MNKILNLMRNTPLLGWMETPELNDRLSGTLKKNSKLGFAYHNQLEEEAIAQTFGWLFEAKYSTKINLGVPLTESDCSAITETGWHFDRLINVIKHPDDNYAINFITIQDEQGNIEKQGIAIVLTKSSVVWIPRSKTIFALCAEYDLKNKIWISHGSPF